jgi:fatty acid desaturase
MTQDPAISPRPAVPPSVDVAGLAAELRALRKELLADRSTEPLEHLKKIERWGRICTALGYATAWMGPNLISAALISQGKFTRWTMIAHHVMHRGYDRVPGVPERYTSKAFARGSRRFVDWFDWMIPEAWHEEHNVLHHYRLGELADPDNVERNLQWLRDMKLPFAAKKAIVAGVVAGWKWVYYAPNTLVELHKVRAKKDPKWAMPTEALLEWNKWNPLHPRGRELWTRSFLPYAAWNFGAVPALYAPLGPFAVASVLANQALAEVITNFHTFAVIGPNHTGEDMWRWAEPAKTSDEFYLRQILGSTNYACGDDLTDFLHGFLNYQIEHHVFPDLSMLEYQRIQPRVRDLCAKYGVPYVQESVWTRVRKTVDVMIGKTSMLRA